MLAALGFTRQAIVRATSEVDAAEQAVRLVRGWLGQGQDADSTNAGSAEQKLGASANDNEKRPDTAATG